MLYVLLLLVLLRLLQEYTYCYKNWAITNEVATYQA